LLFHLLFPSAIAGRRHKPVSPNLLYSYRKVIRESARAHTHTYSCFRAANTYQLLGSAHSSPAMFWQFQSPQIKTFGSFIRPTYLPAAHGMQSLLGSSPDGTRARTHTTTGQMSWLSVRVQGGEGRWNARVQVHRTHRSFLRPQPRTQPGTWRVPGRGSDALTQ